MKKQVHERDQWVSEIDELRKSQQLHQLVLDNAHDLISIHKLVDLSYEYVNPATLKVLGYSKEELLGTSPLDLIHPDDINRVMKRLKEDLPKGEGHHKFRYLRKNGKYVYLEVNAAILPRENDDTALLVISRDITDQEQSEIAKSYYQTIFENTGAATVIIEEDMTITMANEEYSSLLGYEKEELIGAKWTEYIPPDSRAKMMEYHCLRRIEPAAVPHKYEIHLLDKHGNYRDGLITVDIIPGTKKSVATFNDLTEFNRIDRALKAMSAVTAAIIHAQNEEDLLKIVCQKIVEVGGYSLAWIGYVRNDQQQKVQPIAFAGVNNAYLAKLNIALQDPKRGQGPTGIAIKSGKSVVTKDFKKDETFKPWVKDALRRGFKSSMDIPLVADNKSFGVLSIYSNEADVFDNEEQRLLLDMANNLTYAIISLNARLEGNQTAQKLEKSLEKMQRILMQAVTSLGTALDIKDPYTAGHQKKVVRLAVAIAEEMGLSKDKIEGISVAGNLHDIGKINVPSEILSKPGKLSDLEFEMIKTHCQAGFEIIKEIEFPWPVAEILLQHHERMDGSGYPRGLIGDELLLESRIMAVADVVEAMASHRPYRPALGIGIALEEIAKNRGSLYDPDVVDACLRVFLEKDFMLK